MRGEALRHRRDVLGGFDLRQNDAVDRLARQPYDLLDIVSEPRAPDCVDAHRSRPGLPTADVERICHRLARCRRLLGLWHGVFEDR